MYKAVKPQVLNERHRVTVDWYLAQLKPNALSVAVRHLRRQGFETFMPLLEETRRGAQFETRRVPLFPGYLFVSTTERSADVGAVRSTRGVTRLVKCAGRLSPLPASLVDALQARCDNDGVYRLNEDLDVGDGVRITGGPFAQYFGRVHALPSEERVWVLLDVLGRVALTEVPASDISRVR